MKKKPSLASALHDVSSHHLESVNAPTTTSQQTVEFQNTVPPSRRGKKAIAGHFDPAVSRQLHQLALDRDTTVQALLSEALNGLFEKYGRPPVA